MRLSALLLLLAGTALADPITDAADKVLATTDLEKLAALDEPDPWLVADELCRRGKFDHAEAFAKAALRPDTRKLPAFVAAQREHPTDSQAREALAASSKAFAARNYKAVLATIEAVQPASSSTTSVRLLHGRGLALRGPRRLRASAEAFATAGAAARDLGWLRRAGEGYHQAGLSAVHGSIWKTAIRRWKTRLAIEVRRRNRKGVAAALGNIGNVHCRLGRYAKALELQQRSLKLDEEMGNRAGIATTLGNIGLVHFHLGQYAKALDLQQRALEMKQAIGDRAGVAASLVNIGNIHSSLGQYAKALEFQQRALEMMREIGDRAGIATTLGNIGLIHSSLGQRALEMMKAIGDRAGVARTLGNIGGIHRSLGKYAKALEVQQRALEMMKAIGDRAGVAASLGNIGLTHDSLGEYAKALHFQQRALEMNREMGVRAGVAAALGNIGLIHSSLGQYDKALGFQQRALEMRQEIGDRAGVATSLVNIGSIHYFLGQNTKALEFQQRALEMMKAIEDRAGVARTLGNIGLTHYFLGQHAKALDLQQRALEMMKAIGDRAGVARTLGNIGGIHRSLGRYAKALEFQKRALVLARDLGATNVHFWAGSVGWLLLQHLDRPAEAVPLFEEAIAAIEAQRHEARGFSEETRAGFFRTLRVGSPYLGLARTHLRLRHPGAALEALERGRARGVLDLLASSRVDALAEAGRRAREQGDKVRLAAIAKVRADLGAAERDVRGYTHALSQKQVDSVRLSLREKLKRARAVRGEVLGRRAQLVSDLVPVARPASLASIQGALKRKERLLFYAVGEEQSLLFVVPPAGRRVTAHELSWPDGKPVGREQLKKTVRSYLAALMRAGKAARGVAAPARETSGDAAAGVRLSAVLLPKALRDELAGLERVYLVPDGALHRLPLEALPGGALPPMVYGHSGSVLLWCRRKGRRGAERRFEVVALGDPVFSRRKVDLSQPPEKGVLVVAGRGALEAGDVLLVYDRRGVGNAKALRAEVRRVEDEVEETGRTEVTLRVWRAGKQIEVTVKPGSLGIEVARESPRKAWPKLREQSLLTLQRGASVDSFGDLARLPGTRREVEAIQAALGSKRVALLLGEDATKSALFRLAPKGRYLHLATHQLVDETERRGYSRIALTRPRIVTPGDDGFLSLYELFQDWRDRLSACELVVLSACETLKGPMQKDEGPYAMPLGFLYAGAPAVIGSLWRVDDASTAELFADFYARLAKGAPKLQAFTEARKALKKKYPQPYFWAPFVYIGDPR